MKILLLEDDKYLCGNIKQQLTKEDISWMPAMTERKVFYLP